MRIGVLAFSGWIVAAVMTIAVSWSAIGVVRTSVAPQADVSSALATPGEAGATTAAPTTARPKPSPTIAAARGLSGQGGSVTARCTNGVPAIVHSIPQPGFSPTTDDSRRQVKFTSSDHRTEITIACTGSTVTLTKEEKAISGGGGGGDDNGGGNGGGNGRGRGGGGGGGGG